MAKKSEIKAKTIKEDTVIKSLSEIIIETIQDKKGLDIVVMDLHALQNSLFDQFIICSATSKPQSDTIVDSIEFEVKKKLGILPKNVEGTDNATWCVMDYFNILVHVFNPESRTFYQLEKLWADAELKVIENV